MIREDIYREFAVVKAEIETRNERTYFHCQLMGWRGHKIGFSFIIYGCVGQNFYQSQYEAIKQFCTVGALLNCSIVYRLRSNAFVMCIDRIMRLKPAQMDGTQIDVDTYLNSDRGFWVQAIPMSKWVNIPGVIELGGESCIPIVEEEMLPLVDYRFSYDKGLIYDKRPNAFKRVWNYFWTRAMSVA